MIKILDECISSTKFTADEDKLKKVQKDILFLLKRTDGVGELEKRLSRILKELDINNLIRQVRSKADTDEIKKEFYVVDTKINGINDQIGYLRRDYENLFGLCRKLVMSSTSNTQQDNNNLNTMLSTKKIFPLNCLSCGQQGVNINPIHTVNVFIKFLKNI